MVAPRQVACREPSPSGARPPQFLRRSIFGRSPLANFIALIDPDADRRGRFVRLVTPLLPPVDGLTTGSCAAPPFEAVWAADPHAPIDVAGGDGAAIVFGIAIGADGALVQARALQERWHRPGAQGPEPFDGYYAALANDPQAGLVAGADVVGRFPFYYYSSGDVLLVGSSPELFRHHPAFRASFDPHGLVGILLTNGLVEGHTLWDGVRRLGPGYLLAARPGQPPREVLQYELTGSDRYHDQPFEAHVEMVAQALDDAVRRHVPRSPRPLLLLSGGLDSRTVAGFLARQGVSPLAVTRGVPRDFEMQCAVRVARRLRFPHHATDSGPEQFVEDARTRIAWEHCAAGFSGSGGWSGALALRPLGARVVTGDSMDWILGGAASSERELSFDTLIAFHNRWGLRPEVLERLLRREVFGDSVREVMASLRRRFESYPDHDFPRAWCFALHHRQRFHIGSLAWPLTFGAWPIVPVVDMKLLEVAGGLPLSSLDQRRLQIELLRREFPALAALPLDRNSYNTTPLAPSFGWRLRRYVQRRALGAYRMLAPEKPPNVERRRYHRQLDMNGPAWKAIRALAEPHRRLGHEFFHPEVLDELVPPPGARIEHADGITGPAGMRSILGFLLWLSRR